MAEIAAWYAAMGSSWAEGEIDDTDMSVEDLVDAAWNLHPGVSLCHQCTDQVEDVEVELSGFRVNGREYGKDSDTGQWVLVAEADEPTAPPPNATPAKDVRTDG